MIKKIIIVAAVLINSSYAVDDVSIMDLKETVYDLMTDVEKLQRDLNATNLGYSENKILLDSARTDYNSSLQGMYENIENLRSKIAESKQDRRSLDEYKPASTLVEYIEELEVEEVN